MPIEDMDSPPIESQDSALDHNQVPLAETTEPEPTPEPVETAVDPEEVPLTDEEHEEAEAKKKKTGSQRLREKNERLQAELEFYKQRAVQAPVAPPPPQPVKPVVPNIPTLDQFLTAYPQATLDDYEGFKSAAILEQAEQRVLQRLQAQEQARRWDEGVLKAKEEIPDLDEVQDVQALLGAGVNLQGAMRDAILRMDPSVGPKVLHHLAKNIQEARRIAGLPPIEAAVELGALKAALVSKATTKPPLKTTSAPPPLPPARAAGASSPRAYSQLEDF